MKRNFYYFLTFCLLTACKENKPQEVANTDSTASISSTEDTVKTTILTAEDSAKLANEEFEKIFSRTVQILKSGKIRDLKEVIEPESGLFLLFNGGGAYNSYHVFPDMSEVDSLGEDDPAVSRLKTFSQIVGDAKENELGVKYINDVKDPSPCYFKRKGVFAFDLAKSPSILSDQYKSVMQMVGDEVDMDEMKSLKKMERKINREVILNIFSDNGEPFPETMYFTKKDGKWYLIGIDMIVCFSA
jgi:hypothetical protein